MRQWLRIPLLGLFACSFAQAQSDALTIEQAWQLAEKANPTFRKAEAALLAALGEALYGWLGGCGLPQSAKIMPPSSQYSRMIFSSAALILIWPSTPVMKMNAG